MRESSLERTPVLVGIGVAARQEEDFTRALEPIALMLEAVQAAGADSGNAAALRGVQSIAVPHGRWITAIRAAPSGARSGRRTRVRCSRASVFCSNR